MQIKCWGSRGSIPVSGKSVLKYGGDTTCIEIRTKSDDIIIIDAGTGIRRLGNQLMNENHFIYHFIFTHAHWDHVMGFPFFKPLYFRQAQLQMHRCPFHSKFVETILKKVMSPPTFPIKFDDLKAKLNYQLGDNDRIFLSAYTGRDIFSFNDEFGFDWGNTTASLRWNRILDEKLFMNLVILIFPLILGLCFLLTLYDDVIVAASTS